MTAIGCSHTDTVESSQEQVKALISPNDERAVRAENLAELDRLGFDIAGDLPLWSQWAGKPPTLRPTTEIALRLMCAEAATAYIWSPDASEDDIRAYLERSQLDLAFSDDEREIFSTPRAEVRNAFGDSDGWRQENQWALAWCLGFEKQPGLRDGFISSDVMGPLVQNFMPSLEESVEDFVRTLTVRPQMKCFDISIDSTAHTMRFVRLSKAEIPFQKGLTRSLMVA